MGEFSFIVPEWMNWVSLPILAITLFALDYCAAVWLQPTHIPSMRAKQDATTKDIFVFLVIFTLIGAFFGFIASITNVSLGRAILVELFFLAFFLWALLPRKLWLVAAICYEVAFLMAEVVVNYNAVIAGLLSIGIIITILIMVIIILPLNSIKTK